jgi:uncharacterized protein YecT (DUF1311 family)
MGEAKDRGAEIADIKAKAAEEMKARFEEQKRLKAAEEEFRRRLETPMNEAEARCALAEVGLREAQLNLARHSIMSQLSQIDSELASVQMKRAEIAYRLTVPEKPADAGNPLPDGGNPPDGSPSEGGEA